MNKINTNLKRIIIIMIEDFIKSNTDFINKTSKSKVVKDPGIVIRIINKSDHLFKISQLNNIL